MTEPALTATIVITTRDRREELRTALQSAVDQEGPLDVLVVDDGSTDGTAEMVNDEFPTVRLERFERSCGYIARRNHAARVARGDVVVSIDDDAEFRSPRTVVDTLADFDRASIGAVAIPGIDVRRGPEVLQSPPVHEGAWITPSYWGTAHAVRRDLFLALGGYREELGEMFEEVDFCLRMLDAGYATRLGRATPLHHYESAKRIQPRKVFHVWRNNIDHAWRNVPLPYTPVRVLKVIAGGLLFGARNRHLPSVLRGLGAGLAHGPSLLRSRSPITRRAYRLDHDLRRHGPLPMEEVEPRLAGGPEQRPRALEWRPIARAASVRALARDVDRGARFALRELTGSRAAFSYGIENGAARVVVRHNSSDVWTLVEVVHLRSYDPPPAVHELLHSLGRPPRVLDLGANVGMFGALTLARDPHAVVRAYEPDPSNAAVHRRCMELNGSPSSWTLVQACAATSNGSVRFDAHGNDSSRVSDAAGTLEVEARDVVSEMARFDLVKMDIEGSEWDILADPRFGGATAVVLEYHATRCPEADPEAAATRLLAEAGYETACVFRRGEVGGLWAWRPPDQPRRASATQTSDGTARSANASTM